MQLDPSRIREPTEEQIRWERHSLRIDEKALNPYFYYWLPGSNGTVYIHKTPGGNIEIFKEHGDAVVPTNCF